MLLENSNRSVLPYRLSNPWRFMALLTAVVLFLAGCTSEAKVDTEPTVEVSAEVSRSTPTPEEIDPSANPSSTEPSEQLPSAPAEPKVSKPKKTTEMASNDVKGAGLSAIYFLELYNYTIGSRDSKDLEAISTENCKFCSTTYRQVQKDKQSGTRQVGGTLEFSQPEAPDNADVTSIVPIYFDITETSLKVFSSSDEMINTLPAESSTIQVDMIFIDETWLVDAVRVDESA